MTEGEVRMAWAVGSTDGVCKESAVIWITVASAWGLCDKKLFSSAFLVVAHLLGHEPPLALAARFSGLPVAVQG